MLNHAEARTMQIILEISERVSQLQDDGGHGRDKACAKQYRYSIVSRCICAKGALGADKAVNRRFVQDVSARLDSLEEEDSGLMKLAQEIQRTAEAAQSHKAGEEATVRSSLTTDTPK